MGVAVAHLCHIRGFISDSCKSSKRLLSESVFLVSFHKRSSLYKTPNRRENCFVLLIISKGSVAVNP